MYQEIANNTCQPCNPGCLICTGPSLTECQACRDATDPLNASHIISYYLIIGNSICNTTCPTGQFIRAGFPNACQPCSVQCVGCSVTSINCTESFLCSVGYYFYRATNSCLTACPGGYYANTTTKYCEPCIGGCTLCTGGSLQNCTMCKTDLATGTPYYKEIYMTWCVDNCIDG
jgi:proprotein convertase subtilisin/kexin type 5